MNSLANEALVGAMSFPSPPSNEEELTQGRGFTPYYFEPICGAPESKHLISALQLSRADVYDYIDEAASMRRAITERRSDVTGLLRGSVLKAVMRQPSTRTGGSMTTAMMKLGGSGELISGMESSSEAKGESLADSNLALATQADILGIRTRENGGSAFAAGAIDKSYRDGKLPFRVPVINLGDGQNEHVTQALGDIFTSHLHRRNLEGSVAVFFGDHERYRAFHSDMILAATMGMTVVAVESARAARVPKKLADILGDGLETTEDLDEALKYADELNVGRNPDEYSGDNQSEKDRSEEIAEYYQRNAIDINRLQKMSPDAIVKHPRPRRDELNPSVDTDSRMVDVEQMANMIPMRMAIIARHLGKSSTNSSYTGYY